MPWRRQMLLSYIADPSIAPGLVGVGAVCLCRLLRFLERRMVIKRARREDLPAIVRAIEQRRGKSVSSD